MNLLCFNKAVFCSRYAAGSLKPISAIFNSDLLIKKISSYNSFVNYAEGVFYLKMNFKKNKKVTLW